ncbi:MAG: hypothetical protein V5A64_04365 [Candidatus Thermoplasmatota archaeon]
MLSQVEILSYDTTTITIKQPNADVEKSLVEGEQEPKTGETEQLYSLLDSTLF